MAKSRRENEGAATDEQPPPVTEGQGAPPPARLRFSLRSAAYIGGSFLLWLTQGLGLNFITANTSHIQGAIGATLSETAWLLAAYMAPNITLTILLTKIRTQFGMRRFCEVSVGAFVLASLLHLFVHDLWSAVLVRFLAGMAASAMSTMGFLYMLEAFSPPKQTSWGICLALTCTLVTGPLARIMSPFLLDLGQWQQLYLMETGLSLMALAVVFMLPLTPVPHAKVLHWRDAVSYPLMALGFGLIAIVLVVGRNYWWLEAPWLGVSLAVAFVAIGLAFAVELNRDTPLIDVRWLMSPDIIRFGLTLFMFRVVLSEQTTGSVGLFQQLGLLNEQSRILQTVILAASVAGGVICATILRPSRIYPIAGFALTLVMMGAFMDSQATNLTRPEQMYLSQGLIAFGSGLFLPPVMLYGLLATLKRGPHLITSFIAVFLLATGLGNLLGSATFGTFVILREKYHSSHLVEQIVLTNPLVADRVRQLSGAYGRVITDPQLLNAEGVASLSRQITREAYILAYNDAFLAVAIIAAAALACLVLIETWAFVRRRLQTTGNAPSAQPNV